MFVTGEDGYIYAANINPLDEPLDGAINSEKWHEQIGRFETEQGAMGISATNQFEMMTFTSGNSRLDFNGFGVLEVTNDDTLSFEAEIRYVPLGLGSTNDYFDVRQGYGVTLTKDASYAFVAGRNVLGSIFDDEVLDGGNVGIIEDPLGDNPRLVAATRPIPNWLTYDLVLSNDDKYLYVSNPNLSASGDVFVFDVEEIVETLENPTDYVIDGLDRGVGSPFFDESTSRVVTEADFASVPIDDINPEISIAADYEIVLEDRPRNQFTFGVPEDSTRGPVHIGGNPREIAITGGDRLEFADNDRDTEEPDLTPTFNWEFNGIPEENIEEVNLFVSVFDEGNGLLPWDELVDLSGPNGNEFLHGKGLNRQQQLDLLTQPWNVSFYGQENDFNPNRILTATWQREPDDGIGKWTYDGGQTWIEGINTSFTLPENRTLTAGQTYYKALEVFSKDALHPEIEFEEFTTGIPSALNGDDTFRSVTLLTHGFQFPRTGSGVPGRFYDMAGRIVNLDADNPGLILRYDRDTGYWVPVNERGQVLLRPSDDNYLAALREFIAPENPTPDQINYLESKVPLVLVADWSVDSGIPDSGFSEAAADAIFASLVQLDQLLTDEDGENEEDEDSDAKQGPLLNSPLHLVGFSRGTVVNSEIVQRLGTYFPEAGGKPGTGQRDLQMTILDPHDFDQPGLSLLGINSFTDFREPKVRVWDNVTFADNYYHTVPDLLGNSFTPAGRRIPNLPATEEGKTAAGLQFPRQGWRSPDPNPNAPLLGKPDLSVFLGTNKNEADYDKSRAGFTRETDPLYGFGGTHTRVPTWYAGTMQLESTHYPNSEDSGSNVIYRQRGDGHYEPLFDRQFSFGPGVSQPPRVSPWYTPDHTQARFQHGAEDAPWEGIGTGWFYSVLGGGQDLRPQTGIDRVPVDFDNTYDAHTRGDYAVPTLFNGNFDAVFNPKGTFRKTVSQEIPGWSYHGGETNLNQPTNSLVDWEDIPSLNEDRIIVGYEGRGRTRRPIYESYLQRLGIDSNSSPNYALRLQQDRGITHNRFIVPESGALRFDLHVPEFSGGRLLVTLQGEDENVAGVSSFINLTRADRTRTRYLRDTQKIDYGNGGFESFYIDVPENLRGKIATLNFEVAGSGTVYLDNVFFGSEHLLFGNPSNARNDAEDRNNYLLEKPQFATAYNDSTKTPLWVSWQLNRKWLGASGRSQINFIEDPSLPENWERITHGDYSSSDYSRGHMMPSSHRTNSEKDNISSFLMTNVLPQHKDNNDLFQGEEPSSPAWTTFDATLQDIVTTEQKELYVVAGGYGSNPNRQQFSHNSRLDRLTNPQILTDKGINIPGWTWKVVLELDRLGLRFDDVTTNNASAYAILTPNEVEPVHEPRNPDGRAGNDGDFPVPVVHPFNALLGLTLPDIPNKAAWRNWETWQLSVNELETLTELDFFSNIPEPVEEAIEA